MSGRSIGELPAVASNTVDQLLCIHTDTIPKQDIDHIAIACPTIGRPTLY